MKKQRIMLAVLWGLTLAWTVFCLILTWQTGGQTRAFSLSIAKCIVKGLQVIGIKAALNPLHMALRTAAHFVLFFGIGILAQCSVAAAPKGRMLKIVVPVVLAVLALFSEVPKYWIPGRHLTWGEAFLNMAGVLAGYFLLSLICWAIKTHRGKKN